MIAFRISLYILILIPYQICDLQIFSLVYVGCLLPLLLSFGIQNFKIFMMSSLSVSKSSQPKANVPEKSSLS